MSELNEKALQSYLAKTEPELRHIIRNAPQNATGLREAEEALWWKEQKRREDDEAMQSARHAEELGATDRGTRWGKIGAVAACLALLAAAAGLPQVQRWLPPSPTPLPKPSPVVPTPVVDSSSDKPATPSTPEPEPQAAAANTPNQETKSVEPQPVPEE